MALFINNGVTTVHIQNCPSMKELIACFTMEHRRDNPLAQRVDVSPKFSVKGHCSITVVETGSLVVFGRDDYFSVVYICITIAFLLLVKNQNAIIAYFDVRQYGDLIGKGGFLSTL